MGSLDKSDQYLREAECVAESLYQEDVTTIVETLKEADKDLSKQVPALVKLGEWYLNEAKKTENANDFTKADALFNAALVRSRHVHHGTDEDQILRRIVETYREFLASFAKDDDGMSVDEIRNEIDSHKEWVARERKILKERVDQNGERKQKDEVLKIRIFDCSFDIFYTNNVYDFRELILLQKRSKKKYQFTLFWSNFYSTILTQFSTLPLYWSKNYSSFKI